MCFKDCSHHDKRPVKLTCRLFFFFFFPTETCFHLFCSWPEDAWSDQLRDKFRHYFSYHWFLYQWSASGPSAQLTFFFFFSEMFSLVQ